MPRLPQSVIDERSQRSAADAIARDRALVTTPAQEVSPRLARNAYTERVAAQARLAAIDAAAPAPEVLAPAPVVASANIAPEAIPNTGLFAGQPTDTGASFGGVNSDIEARYRELIAPPPPPTSREQIEALDLSDLNAIREQMRTDSAKLGRPVKSGSIAGVDTLEQARRAEARQGIAVNDRRAIDEQNATRQAKATDSLVKQAEHTMANRNMDDATKEQFQYLTNLAKDPQLLMAAEAAGIDVLGGIDDMMDAMDRAELARRGGKGYAEGGEIMPTGAPEMPEAIPTEPMQLDSGDYIIPVEAMRFYGRKFFQDLINKAEDAE